jgi:hypothetical protein
MIDLTKNTEAWCLMSDEKRAAFGAYNGPIEVLRSGAVWGEKVGSTWFDAWIYRAKPQPVRGEVVFSGSLKAFHSLHPGDNYSNPTMPARVTMSTIDGLLIPGEYIGPDGATIKIEAL